jgi:shikimate dehydrogenase
MNLNVFTANIPPSNKVYQLQDLENWKFPGPSLAVLGHPIAHSLSPRIHNAALQKMGGKYKKWRYFAFDIPHELLGEAMVALHVHNFIGINLTIPHKVEALDLVASVDPVAEKMGAVNTLIRQEFGYHGKNTDGYGIETALKQDLGVSISGSDVIILGAGGASRATVVQCLNSGCRKVWLGNRSIERLNDLVESIGGPNDRLETFALAEPPTERIPDDAILINATSLGLKPEDPSPVDLRLLPKGLRVYDMIYNPPDTALIKMATSLGYPTANGLSMLVHQAAKSLHYWTEAEVPVSTMFDVIQAKQTT